MNSRKPKQSSEPVAPTPFEGLELQLVVPDRTQKTASKTRQPAEATLCVRLPPAKARTLH